MGAIMPEYSFENFFELSMDMLCIANVNGYFLRVNPSFQRILGWTSEDLLSRPFIEFIHPDDVKITQDEVQKLAKGNPTSSFINRYRCSSGDYRYLLWTAYPDKETGLLFAIAHDTTELVEENQRFHLAIDASPVALLMVEQHGVIQFVNKEVEHLFQYPRELLIGKHIEMLVPANIHVQHQRDRMAFFNNPKARSMGTGRHVRAVRRDGVSFPVEIGLNPVILGESVFVLCSVVDMTRQKQVEERMINLAKDLENANEQLAQLAITDRLTGIHNRRAFDEQLRKQVQLASRTKQPVSLLLVDIDHFKKYNDKYGHLVGDETLKGVAKLIKDNARATDITARFGGEEFALVLPDTGVDGASQMAERFRNAIQAYAWSYEPVTISVGISTMLPLSNREEQIIEHIQTLITEADKALYYSKDNGRNLATHASDIANMDNST